MSYTYANRRRADKSASQKETAQQPSMDALRSGAAQPTAEQMGHRVDLPDAMRSKMEDAFGADLSAVKLYESQSVADAGATAMTQGANIAFAPGMLDFTSFGGQSLLGHEISHVVSQARGEVTGGGFLNDHALEARADREGAMAAAGQTVAVPTAAMSTVSAANAAGPMQAKDKKGKKNAAAAPQQMVPTSRALQAQAQFDYKQADNDAKNASYHAAIERYNAGRGDLPAYDPSAGDVRTRRFLQRHMTGTDEENDALFRDVMTRGDAAMMPTFAKEARRIMDFDPSEFEGDDVALQRGGEIMAEQNNYHNLFDMINDQRVTAESIGFTEDEFETLAGKYDPAKGRRAYGKRSDFANAGGAVQARLKQLSDEKEAATFGTKTSDERFSYRTAPLPDASVSPSEYTHEQQLAVLYNRIKNPAPGDDADTIARNKRLFAHLSSGKQGYA